MKVNLDSFKQKLSDSRTTSLLILVLVVVLLVLGGALLVRDYDLEGMTATLSQRAEELESRFVARDADEPEEDPEEFIPDEEPEGDPVEVVSKEVYRETAQRGDGLTHLARRALDSYLRDTGQTVSNAERIYIEDYVQMRIPLESNSYSRWLTEGQEVEISQELLEEAVQKAGGLGEAELQNLEYYAALVF